MNSDEHMAYVSKDQWREVGKGSPKATNEKCLNVA